MYLWCVCVFVCVWYICDVCELDVWCACGVCVSVCHMYGVGSAYVVCLCDINGVYIICVCGIYVFCVCVACTVCVSYN